MAMEYRSVTAVVRVDRVEQVVRALQALRVSGVSVSEVKGYGEYVDFFARDWLSSYARVEILTSTDSAPRVCEAVLAAATTGTRGDGIVAVAAVESVLRIRDRSPIPPDQL